MLVDMSISILIFDDGCCLDLSVSSTCHLRLKNPKFPIAPMGNADALALILACTTATDTSVNYRGCVLKRPCKVPIAPMGFSHVLRLCSQGGGVAINGGSVTFSSCTITDNTSYQVCAHAQKFPSPRWEFLLTCPIDSPLSIRIDIWFYQGFVRASHAC